MLDKDIKYYLIQQGDQYEYRIAFIPGSENAVNNNYELLPPDWLTNKFELSASYENEQPWGLPITDELKLTFDLTNMYDSSYATWSEFRQWLMDGTATTAENYFNAVEVMRKLPTDVEYTPYFFGIQEVKPEKQIDVNGDKMDFTLTFISVFRYILESFKWSDLPHTITDYDAYYVFKNNNTRTYGYDKTIDNVLTVPVGFSDVIGGGVKTIKMAFTHNEPEGTQYNWIKHSTFLGYLQSAIQTRLRRVSRNIATEFSFTDSYLKHLDLYYNNADVDLEIGITNNEDLFLLWSVYNNAGQLVAGLMSDNDKNVSLYKWKTPLDFLKAAADGYICKAYFNYNPGLSDPPLNDLSVKFMKIYDQPVTFTGTITKSDIQDNKLTIKKGAKIIQTAIARNHGVAGDGNNEYTEQRDGAESDQKWEGLIPFHNNIANYLKEEDKKGINEVDFANSEANNIENDYVIHGKVLPTFTYLYIGRFAAGVLNTTDLPVYSPINDKTQLNLSDVLYTASDTRPAFPELVYNWSERYWDYSKMIWAYKKKIKYWDTYNDRLFAWINENNNKRGIAHCASKAALRIMGRPKQVILEFATSSDKCNISHLGCIYTINVSSLLPFNIDLDINSTDAILIECTTDLIKEQSTVKFIIPDL